MTLEEAERRITSRMTPSERDEHERGCQIVDFYMAIALDPSMPAETRDHARHKLRAFVSRDSGQTVADIDGKATH
jgi:hypothetical protein